MNKTYGLLVLETADRFLLHETLLEMFTYIRSVKENGNYGFIVAEPEKCQVFSLAYEWLNKKL